MAIRFLAYDDTAGRHVLPDASDDASIDGSATIGGNTSLEGDLIVDGGNATTINTRLMVGNRYLNVNTNYSTAAAVSSGLVFNIEPDGVAVRAIEGIASNVISVDSDPTSDFAAGDIILLVDPFDSRNGGFYEVLAVSAAPDEIEIDPTPTEPFSGSSLQDDATIQGTVVKVQVGVIRISSTGDLETAFGDTVPLVYSTPGGGSTTLQDAYDNGATITTAGGTPVLIDGTEKFQVTATSGIDLDAPLDMDTAGNLTADVGSFSFDATGASNVTVDGAALTLSATNGGSSIQITSATGGVTCQFGTSFNIQGTGATAAFSATSLTEATISTGGTVTGPITISTAAGSNALNLESGPGGSNLTSANGNINIETTVNGSVDIISNNRVGLGANYTVAAANTLVLGSLVYISGTNEVALADASAASTADVVGISDGGYAAASTASIYHHGKVRVLFGAAPAGASNGDRVYLSETAGEATLTAPSTPGTVVFEVGILTGADGASTTPAVILNPRFILVN